VTSLQCIYFNARSIVHKMECLLATVESTKPDIVGISETWTTEEISDAELGIAGYDLYRKDRGSHGGGVLMYVRSSLQSIDFYPVSTFQEQVWCRIPGTNGKELLVGVCYRSPSESVYGSKNHHDLRNLISEVKAKQLLLMGDFNYPGIDWSAMLLNQSATENCRLFLECLEDNFLIQHVRVPTRLDAVLDLVITNEPDMISEVTSLGQFGSSDHNILSWSTVAYTKDIQDTKLTLDYKKGDYDGLRKEVRSLNWDDILQSSVSDGWIRFKDKLLELERKYIPVRSKRRSTKKAPWMTYKAVKLITHKHRVFAKYKDNKHPAYIRAAKEADLELRKSRRRFEEKLAENIKQDNKSFYSYVRKGSTSRGKLGPLEDESGHVTESASEAAEEFNKYFSSVFTDEDMSFIPATNKMLDEGHLTQDDMDITEELVLLKLRKLRADKAPGADGMLPRFLLEIVDEICHPVTVLLRRSMDTGQVPDDWKQANVSPIYKKGSRLKAENYRPVSLTSQLCKVFESLIRDVIVRHLEDHHLINDSQHGFRKGRSCLSNLLVFLDRVTDIVDQGDNADVIFLDFAKAFDKVPHARLIAKIRSHGIGGRLLAWIEEWLKNRRQRVCVQGRESGWRWVSSGVPQGSVLGPVLFLIYINDLDGGMLDLVLKFADDTKIWAKVNELSDGAKLQAELSRLVQWSGDWQMMFNIGKCKVMHFGHNNPSLKYYMNSKELEAVTVEKDLGVWISNDLKVSVQCSKAYNRASMALGMINRAITWKTPSIMLALYKTLVRPHLEYCTVVWSPYYCKDKALLERIQHRFSRMIPGFRFMEYSQRLARLGLWTLEERRNRADLIEVYKMWRGLSSVKFDQFFETDASCRTRGHSLKLRKHHCRLDLRQHFFSERVVNNWNGLDQHTIDSSSLNAFKNNLKYLRSSRMDLFLDDVR